MHWFHEILLLALVVYVFSLFYTHRQLTQLQPHLRPTNQPPTTTTTTTTTTRPSTAAKLWKAKAAVKYDVAAAAINALDAAGIDAFLFSGSALGAYRNHGMFSWDKDIDLFVVSSNHTCIRAVLDALPGTTNQSKHHHLNSGHKYGETDFGYHAVLTGEDAYMDVWLAEELPGDQLRLISGDTWCKAVGVRGVRGQGATCQPMPRGWFFPPIFVPFGPYLMPTPRDEAVVTSTWLLVATVVVLWVVVVVVDRFSCGVDADLLFVVCC